NAQYEFDKFLRELEKYVRLSSENVFAYEIYAEFEEKIPVKVNLPSNLPLVGSFTNVGIILSNDATLDMRLREFTTIQIDKVIRVIKRSPRYFSYQDVKSGVIELKKILKSLSIAHSG
ncbi:MAG: hypothetical protein QXW51_05880, partial [Sulfolobaceae archaeon]